MGDWALSPYCWLLGTLVRSREAGQGALCSLGQECSGCSQRGRGVSASFRGSSLFL